MFEISVSRVIERAPDVAYQYLRCLENDASWWVGVIDTRCADAHPETGCRSRYYQQNKLLGVRFCVVIEIVEDRAPSKLSYRSVSGTPVPFAATFLFEPYGSGTRVTMIAQIQARSMLFRCLGPLFRWNLRRITEQNFDNLKRVLESGA